MVDNERIRKQLVLADLVRRSEEKIIDPAPRSQASDYYNAPSDSGRIAKQDANENSQSLGKSSQAIQ